MLYCTRRVGKVIKMERNESENNVIVMPNYVVKLKQDRYGTWICSEMRIQGDTIKEVDTRIKAASKLVEKRQTLLNAKVK